MHRKNIRLIITKQLKTEHPHWKKMTRKSKKKLLQQIVDEAVNNYDYSQTLDIPVEELIGVEDQMPSEGIRSIPEMAAYIKNFHSDNLFDFDKRRKPYSEIVDQELQFIDQLLDDQVINSFIVPDGYSAPHREIQPYQLFQMELLKIIKYPEINYPICTVEVKGKKIRIYSDPDCDCGKRRNNLKVTRKRDKSYYVIGYRLHTLTAINPSTGHSFPLVSIVGAANHHDSLFLKPLIKLVQAIGIDMKLITADQAYHDKDGSILDTTVSLR